MTKKDLEARIKELEKLKQDLICENKEFKHKTDLLERVDELIYRFELHPERRFTYVSASATEIVGYSPEDHYKDPNLGMKIIHPEDKQLLEKAASDVGQDSTKMILRWLKKNGDIIWTEHSIKYITDEKGKLIALEGIATDITEQLRAKSVLKQSEEKFRAIFNESPIGIEIYDAAGLQINANAASLQMFGISSFSEVEKFNLFEGTSLSEENRAKLKNGETISYQATFDFDKVKSLGQYATTKSGTKEFDYIISPLSGSQKEVAGYMLLVQDITEQKRAEMALKESELFANAIVNTTPALLYIYDLEKERNIWVNEIHKQYFRELTTDATELKNDEIARLVHPDDFSKLEDTTEKMVRNPDFDRFELEIRLLQGDEVKWMKLITSVFKRDKDGKAVQLLGALFDIDREKRAEADLIKAKEKAEESDRLKSTFLANMSHEIRTPMNGILGFADLLKEPELTGKEQERYIKVIEKSGQRMLNIINDLINISRIEAGQVEVNKERTNINDQLDYLYNFFKQEADKKGIAISHICPLPSTESNIFTDQEKVYAILMNLIKNAIKYTNSGSIKFGYYPKNGFIEFFVRDTGIGIPRDKQGGVFDRFNQVHPHTDGQYQGAGLGLAISKAYVEMLGGKIWFKSKEGEGTSFFFKLPVTNKKVKASVSEKNTSDLINSDLNNLVLLIAEDDVSAIEYLLKVMQDKCKKIYSANNGQEAISMIKENPDIKLILMDIKMPGMDGYEASRKIREFNQDVVIIAQTAFALEGDREKAIEAGCNDYISKPISKNKLLGLIERNLG